MFDCSAILRDAHARTRTRMAPHWCQRQSDRWDATLKSWVPEATYREIFANCLRAAWTYAKAMARHAILEAVKPVLSLAAQRRVVELRVAAQFQPYTRQGAARSRAFLDEVAAITEAARAHAFAEGDQIAA